MSINQLFAYLVLSLRLDPLYVLYELSTDELTTLLNYSYYANKDAYEQSRLIAYTFAQCNTSKAIKPTDVIKFSWEQEEENRQIKENTSDENKQRLQKMSNFYAQHLNDLKEVE